MGRRKNKPNPPASSDKREEPPAKRLLKTHEQIIAALITGLLGFVGGVYSARIQSAATFAKVEEDNESLRQEKRLLEEQKETIKSDISRMRKQVALFGSQLRQLITNINSGDSLLKTYRNRAKSLKTWLSKSTFNTTTRPAEDPNQRLFEVFYTFCCLLADDDAELLTRFKNKQGIEPALIEMTIQVLYHKKQDAKVMELIRSDALSLGSASKNAYKLGSFFQSVEVFDQAEAAYLQAIKENVDNPLPYVGLGQIYFRQQKNSVARSYLEQAIVMLEKQMLTSDAARTHLSIALIELGRVEKTEKQFAESIRRLKRAEEVSQNDALIIKNNLADVYLELDRLDLASNLINEVLKEVTIPSTAIMSTLGTLYEKQGRWLEAETQYCLAHFLEPKKQEYIESYARAADALGDRELAMELRTKLQHDAFVRPSSQTQPVSMPTSKP